MGIPKLIAMYLPQFHPIPENDAWWGEGFTEWTNVRKAKPRFKGHYQPHVPGQLGYYDLRDPDVRSAQAELARQHGIYGFCYYHYWFNGKRLLEAPFNEVLKSGEPDFPFCLCWANENWSRRWDGSDQQILMAQHYSDEDSINFIRDLIPAFRDKRYIRVNGKPLLLVYRTGLLPDPKKTTEIWREEMSKVDVGDLYLVRVENCMDGVDPNPESIGFDAAMEFAPNWGMIGPKVTEVDETGGVQHTIPNDLYVRDYSECMRRMVTRPVPDYKRFRGVFPCWDNSARRKKEPTIFINSSPAKYAFWLAVMFRYTFSRFQGDERLVFVNAWNEWGEGCHLEPDEKSGLAYLEATRLVLEHFSVGDKKMHALENIVASREAAFEGWLELIRSVYGQCPDGNYADSDKLDNAALTNMYLEVLTVFQQLEAECLRLTADLAERDQQLAELGNVYQLQVEDLQDQLSKLEQSLVDLRNSATWRLTASLRKAYALVTGGQSRRP